MIEDDFEEHCDLVGGLCPMFWGSLFLVILMVSLMGMLTYRSLMSKVRSLCLGVILSFVTALAKVLEFVAYWLSRCRLWFRILFSFLATL